MQATLRRDEIVDAEDLPQALEDPRQRARLILSAASEGHLDAQVMLGQILLQGSGIQRDTALALTWFKLAADQGNAMALNMLGRCHEHAWGCPADAAQAAHYYREAAQRGLDWGMYNLANLLATGRGVPCDETAAFALYQRAAALGHAKSMNLLGRCYEEGLGVARDLQAAQQCYQRSAEAGDFRGQFSWAGVLLQQGQIDAAQEWMRHALSSGNLNFLRSACRSLAKLELPELQPLILSYHQRAAELGDASDQQALQAFHSRC